ncbi:MAG: radical SAM protein [Chlamydiota bacterium]
MPDVVLINPPSSASNPTLPLGLASIAAVLREQGVSVGAVDAWALGLGEEGIIASLRRNPPRIAGITMMAPRAPAALRVAAAVREALPEVMIVAGGPHPSAVPKELIAHYPFLDAAVFGEGEFTMLDIVRAAGKRAGFPGIPGVAWRDGGGGVVVNQPRPLIPDLDALPPPARDLFPLDRYRINPPYGMRHPSATMVTIRGCPFRCIYCSKSVFGPTVRAMSPGAVVDEVERLTRTYGVREIKFYDDDFTLIMDRAAAICDEIIRRGIGISWSCTTRVNLVNEALLRKMKEAGCWLISYGVESASQTILDRARKGFNLGQVRDAFRWTRAAEIKIHGYFMVGLPGETEETLKATIELAKELGPDTTSWGPTTVYPGTPLFMEVAEGKFPRTKIESYDRKDGALENYAFGDGRFLLLDDGIPPAELARTMRRAYLSFYLRPRYFLQTIRKIRSLADFRYYLFAGIEFLRQMLRG